MGVQEYRSKSATCFLTALHFKLPDVRARWLAMAQAWNRLADEADREQLTDLLPSKESASSPSDQS
jgi:hypothetical protein